MTDLCNEVEKFGKGIGNASRYRIIEALYYEQKTVGELVKKVKLSQPAVSQHLKTLKSLGLVADQRKGKEVFYSLNSQYLLTLLKKLTSEVKNNRSK